MSQENYYGYKVTRGCRSCTVWVFKKKNNKLVGTLTRRCDPRLTREQRETEIADFLNTFGIALT
jgi:hypothetical protein